MSKHDDVFMGDMTILDHFACVALAELVRKGVPPSEAAPLAYTYADEMMDERESAPIADDRGNYLCCKKTARGRQCKVEATVEHLGKYYCHLHDPNGLHQARLRWRR